MTQFFEDVDAMHRYSLELDLHQIECAHCAARGQFVSHGFVYKKAIGATTDIVGKRILCTPRGERSGCGRTVRLYLADRIPRLHHAAACVTAFVLALIAGLSVTAAYEKATSIVDARNAWRWLNKLKRRLLDWRSRLAPHVRAQPAAVRRRSPRLQLLIETLVIVFGTPEKPSCQSHQLHTQSAFF